MQINGRRTSSQCHRKKSLFIYIFFCRVDKQLCRCFKNLCFTFKLFYHYSSFKLPLLFITNDVLVCSTVHQLLLAPSFPQGKCASANTFRFPILPESSR